MSDAYNNSESSEMIVCPYCGKEYEPSYEETYIGHKYVECYEEGNQGEFTCERCGKRFNLTNTFTWVYETETIDGEMTNDEWESFYDRNK